MLETFTLFNKLPAELQDMVWDKVPLTGRIIACRVEKVHKWKMMAGPQAAAADLIQRRAGKPSWWPLEFSFNTPLLLRVCKGSRQQTLKRYRLLFTATTMPTHVYFNSSIDVVHLTCPDAAAIFFTHFTRQEAAKMQMHSIAITRWESLLHLRQFNLIIDKMAYRSYTEQCPPALGQYLETPVRYRAASDILYFERPADLAQFTSNNFAPATLADAGLRFLALDIHPPFNDFSGIEWDLQVAVMKMKTLQKIFIIIPYHDQHECRARMTTENLTKAMVAKQPLWDEMRLRDNLPGVDNIWNDAWGYNIPEIVCLTQREFEGKLQC